MRIAACAVLTLVACHPGSDDSFPIVPGGDDSPITPPPDTTPADASGDAATAIAGRVCVVTDLRSLTSGCATTGVAGIAVTLGTRTTVTLADGTFTMSVASGETPSGAWSASGAAYVTSRVLFGGPNLIPMTTEARYAEILLANGMVSGGGQGAIIGRVSTSGAARPGITASTAPVATYVAHYDAATALQWEQDATGANGVFWIPGAPVGDVAVTLTPGTLTPVVLPVGDQAITFATFDIL